jgi:hypothetical protein
MALGRVPLPTIPVGATQPITFDFTDVLAQGETISSTTVTLSVYSGTDGAPSGNKSGSASISGAVVSQKIKPVSGALGNIYQVVCDAVTSLSNTFQKAGLLAVPPDTDTTVTVTNSTSPVLTSFSTGLITTVIAPTPVLTSTQNAAGGMYQMNVYTNSSGGAGAGTILVYIYWTDRVTGAASLRISGGVSASGAEASEQTYPIDALAGTQILVETVFSGVVGSPSYLVEVTVSRL